MNKLDVLVLFLRYALHVHEARRVGTSDIFGSCGHVAHDLVLAHSDGNVWLLHGKHAAEAATLVLAIRLVNGYARLEFKKVYYLVV